MQSKSFQSFRKRNLLLIMLFYVEFSSLTIIISIDSNIKITNGDNFTNNKLKHIANEIKEIKSKESENTKQEQDSIILDYSNNSNNAKASSLLQTLLKTSQPDVEELCVADFHKPFGEETRDMRYSSLLTIILVSLLTFIIRLLFSFISEKLPSFSLKVIQKTLITNFIYLLFFSFFFILFSYSAFDELETNLEKLFLGILVFQAIWVAYTFIIIFSFTKYIIFLSRFNNNTLSFKSLKSNYEKIVNVKYGYNSNNNNNLNSKSSSNLSGLNKMDSDDEIKDANNDLVNVFEHFEYLLMKQYFISPFTPIFKPSLLRDDFNFGDYLKLSLIEQLTEFFSFSWTSMCILLFLVLTWSTVIDFISISVSQELLLSYIKYCYIIICFYCFIQTIFMLCFPIPLTTLSFIINIYLKVIYRRYIPKINETNYLDYQSIAIKEKNSNYSNILNTTKYPNYLEKILNNKENNRENKKDSSSIEIQNGNHTSITVQESKTDINNNNNNNINGFLTYYNTQNNGYSMTKHFNIRTTNFYEDNIVFGKTGFKLFNNMNQSINMIFLVWFVVIITKYFNEFMNDKDHPAMYIILANIVVVVFLVINIILSYSNIKYLNIMNCMEANKKEHLVKEVINSQIYQNASNSNNIIQIFKKIYFDILINSKKDSNNDSRDISNDDNYSIMNNQNNINSGIQYKTNPQNFNVLTKAALKQMIDLSIIRFKFIDFNDNNNTNDNNHIDNKLDSNKISLGEELRYFLKSCGASNVTDKEIEFMIHLVEDFQSVKTNKMLSSRDFYDIWGANIHFTKIGTEELMRVVIDTFLHENKGKMKENKSNNNSSNSNVNKEFGLEGLKKMLDWYSEYFVKEDKDFIIREAEYLKPGFSQDTFISYYCGICQHCPQ